MNRILKKAMERISSMTKWGRTFIDYGLYASYLSARQARHDNEHEITTGKPSIAKTVFPDGRTVYHVKRPNN
jgi:hypothetical protein